eukprot:CAMPEP_0117747012 /NCGR_PEP_ID=MMETSP0947-20121206/8267_1 /TAXON_ID=44440 /ORGANISM="Chattonella subsalsa, Strain CCMP2191" /LENGTH=316 /DNA_ID=CAMNT_0005564403 /DNA_START=266 /DNA_END=1216 /DNA_ORIENTATION=-
MSPLCMAEEDDAPRVVFGSEIKTPEMEREEARRRIQERIEEDKGVVQQGINYGPSSMSSYVNKGGDSDFDGGDGQVGVVGDGEDNMEKFDERSVIKGSTIVNESRSRQRNAWGSGSTGYAEELKKSGMVDYNLKGEDKLQVRRQQLENYSNQMALKRAQDAAIDQMEAAEGTKVGRNTKDYFEAMSSGASLEEEKWNVYKPEEPDFSEITFGEVSATGRIRKEYEIVAAPGKAGEVAIEQRNIVMTFQPFRAAFPAGTSSKWSVRPESGVLERRGGETTVLTVTYRPDVMGPPEEAMLVVDTEEFKHIYKITGSSG